MKLSFQNLEKEYYKVLYSLASGSINNSKVFSRLKLPYALENVTLDRIAPEKTWIISAISGTGKTTIVKQLSLKGFQKLPNVTTRPKRLEEENSEYVFIDKKKFKLWDEKGLLFDPHKRNGVWHAILKNDIKKFIKKDSFYYLDKSVSSSIKFKNNLPKKINVTFIYLLPPTFKELRRRILKREHMRDKIKVGLSKKEILKRFKEEINDMKLGHKIRYTYIVNDSLDRVHNLLRQHLKKLS